MIQLIQVLFEPLQIIVCRQNFHRLDMVAVIVPPATHLPVHVFHFPIMRFDQFPLVDSNSFVDLF